MTIKTDKRHIISNEHHGAVKSVERAQTDGAWRSRPLWRCVRPDHHYGPKLTAAARRSLKVEANHADHRTD